MTNLRVVVRNEQPQREERYPQTWLLYKGIAMIELHVAHDSQNRPRVLYRSAA